MNEFDPIQPENGAAMPEENFSPPVSSPSDFLPPPTPRKMRRVGTSTMGLALIATGLLIAIAMFAPNVDLTLAFRLSPLLLVLLGCEVLFFSLRSKDEKIKYDWLSMFVCFILVVSSLGLALVPKMLTYYGPERERTESRLTRELGDNCYTLLANEKSVFDCTGYVYFQGWDFDKNASLETLRSDPDSTYSSLDFKLAGNYAQGDKTAFATDVARILASLQNGGYPVDRMNFRWNNASETAQHEMSVEISSRFALNKTPAELAEMVNEHYSEYTEEEDTTDYQTGYDNGYSEGYTQAQQEASASVVSEPTSQVS